MEFKILKNRVSAHVFFNKNKD